MKIYFPTLQNLHEKELEKLDNFLKNIKHEETRIETFDSEKKVSENTVVVEKNEPISYKDYIVGYNDDIYNKDDPVIYNIYLLTLNYSNKCWHRR